MKGVLNPLHSNPRELVGAIILPLLLLGVMAGSVRAENPEDNLGTWFGASSAIRFSDRWSLFLQGEVRVWEVVSNLQETLGRIAGHYDISPKAMVGLGYVRSDVWPFDDRYDSGRERKENRLYQQFALKQTWARARFEHRFRLEQRWLEVGGHNRYSNRWRYRIQVTVPLTHETMQAGVFFINSFNETFINFDSERSFDQNRLYVAGGYTLTALSNLQLGMLWQARSEEDFFRLQIYYTHNFDLRKN